VRGWVIPRAVAGSSEPASVPNFIQGCLQLQPHVVLAHEEEDLAQPELLRDVEVDDHLGPVLAERGGDLAQPLALEALVGLGP
jgi:hypothetical protein